jgi:hypothetical protein
MIGFMKSNWQIPNVLCLCLFGYCYQLVNVISLGSQHYRVIISNLVLIAEAELELESEISVIKILNIQI